MLIFYIHNIIYIKFYIIVWKYNGLYFNIHNILENSGVWPGDQQLENAEHARWQRHYCGTGTTTLSRFRPVHGREKRRHLGLHIGRLQRWLGIFRCLAARPQHPAMDVSKRVHSTVSGVLSLGCADSGGSHVHIRRYSQSE